MAVNTQLTPGLLEHPTIGSRKHHDISSQLLFMCPKSNLKHGAQ